MTVRPFSAGRLLWPALLLGVAGDFLFRAGHLGLNLVVWVGAVLLVWYWAARRHGGSTIVGAELSSASTDEPPSRTWEHGLLLTGLALAAAWAWRDNAMLRFLDGIGLIVVFALLPLARLPEASAAFARLPVAHLLRALLGLGGRGATGLLPIVLDAQRATRYPGKRAVIPVAALARGLVIAVPAGVVFGGLLGSADPVFGDAIRGLIAVDPELLIGHALGVTAAAWAAATLLRGLLPGTGDWLPDLLSPLVRPSASPSHQGLGAIEVTMTLGVVNALFAGFVAFQLPYFFGGAEWVERTAGLTLAQYARRGFFELVVVTALVLPLLLGLNAWLSTDNSRALRIFRWLAGTQLILVFAIIASGMHRMALYQREFGLTQDRLFASAFMAGTAVTCLWFAATVLQGRSLLFARGALLAWGAWLALLNVVNPDQVIVNTNLGRYAEGKGLDAHYLTRLSTDAVPALVAALPALPDAERQIVRDGLLKRHDIYSSDIRDWHYGRTRARRAILTLYEAASP